MQFEQWHLVVIGALAVVTLAVIFLALRKKTSQSKVLEVQSSHISAGTPASPTSITSDSSTKEKSQASAPVFVADSTRVSSGLQKTRLFFQSALDRVFNDSDGQKFYDNLEEALLSADVGIDFAEKVIQQLKQNWGIKIPEKTGLQSSLIQLLESFIVGVESSQAVQQLASNETKEVTLTSKPHVILIVGVNGAGKTTTIAKLCQKFQNKNLKVLVGAADTFRAAATEQLKTWVERTGAEGVFQKEGSDPSAVAFDAVQAATSRNADICIIDTAGRLHTKQNLMDELKKLKRVTQKALSTAPNDIWLVVDGTTGQNALQQAKEFHEAVGLTGVVVTKLDGSAKGGIVLSIASQLKVPVVFIGVGETVDDLVPFESHTFVRSLIPQL